MLAVVLAVLIALGLFQHMWNLRAAEANDPAEVMASLQRIPLRVTRWEGQDDTDDYTDYPAGAIGPIRSIRYVDRAKGETLRILITAGMTGPMLVYHQPTDCYPGIGYELVAPAIRHKVVSPTDSAEFWVGRFTKSDGPAPSHLRVYWSFSATGDWQVPRSPRLAFARSPCLFKMYVIRVLRKADEALDKDPAQEFIRDFVPELRKTLFSPQENRGASK